MLINGIELSSLGATLHNRVLSSNTVKTVNKWTDGSLEPTFIRQQDSFKTINLEFLITDQNEENAFVTMSNITMLLKRAIIIFDDMPNLQFDVTLQKKTSQQRLKNGNFILSVSLSSDYAKGSTEIHTTDTAATDTFNLSVVYYKDNTQLIEHETIKINSSSFVDKENVTFADLGINLNKYQPAYYNQGSSNFTGTLSYQSLLELGALIINYAPTVYYKDVQYYLNNGENYDLIETVSISFTYDKINTSSSIGQIVDLNRNRPNGYKATCKFNQDFTFDNLMAFPMAILVYFDIIENEQTKDIAVTYTKETADGDEVITTSTIVVRESNVVEGSTLQDIIGFNNYKPNDYYEDGICEELEASELVTFDTLNNEYTIHYTLTEYPVYVEYYKGTYPDWRRAYTDTLFVKYDETYNGSEDIIADLGINLNKYKTNLYNEGAIFNSNIYVDFNSIVNIGLIQVYYVPKEYTITVNYIQNVDEELTQIGTHDYVLTDLMFQTEPQLAEIIDINLYRPEGYRYDAASSYSGEVSLTALTSASPLTITYKAVEVVRTKSVVVRYKKQYTNVLSTIDTAVITIEEATAAAGIKLKDLIEINKFKPEYYNNGIIDGYSSDAIVTFEEINGNYDVLYYAASYSTQIRYYTDEIATENWIGSDRITFTILDFESETSLTSLGVDINKYKPPYCDDGVVQPYGGLTFSNLISIGGINIVYTSVEEPGDDSGIDYPHRILFLQHNDMGSYEKYHPTWTFNHAYINTGVVADDISQTTVTMSVVYVVEPNTFREINPTGATLFGAKSSTGDMYISYQNDDNLPDAAAHTSLPNYFVAKAGKDVQETKVAEPYKSGKTQYDDDAIDTSNSFSRNTGIYASDRPGYSYLTLTYSQLMESDNGNTQVPLYLFACNNRGNYQGGIQGVGITACKIYKNGVLVRDYIPVAYYDLIGTKVAPSNCLYDKVTQTFFEDARQLNSFNIIDDDEYEDTNPQHKIGKCYVNYSKGGQFFQSNIVYFRGSDFVNGHTWDPQDALKIDEYQPRFFGAGVITNINELQGITFENVNNFVFEVDYPSNGYQITVNYYQNEVGQGNLLATEQVPLDETMFYQVPTFGQLFDLLKYKPAGYGLKPENYPYNQSKVTLERILQNQPYDIVYTPWNDAEEYNIQVKYYKHKNWIDPRDPLSQYEYIGYQDVTINETEIIDGVYPEQFINFNLLKPIGESNYWADGVPYEWYLEDENLLTPEDLREEYIVVYEPIPQSIEIKYYTDEVDEDDYNLIATDSWSIKINDWGFGEQFQIVDELPNSFINKFKPGNCEAGQLQDADTWFTFDSLVTQGHLDILYMSKTEPHDPDDDSYPDKVIFYHQAANTEITENNNTSSIKYAYPHTWQLHNGASYPMVGQGQGAKIPWINLGYTPKEIGRLAIQTKAYSVADSCWDGGGGRSYAPILDDYTYFLGYYGATPAAYLIDELGYDNAKSALFGGRGHTKTQAIYTPYSAFSKGWLAFRGHIPEAKGFSKQYDSVQDVDGNNGWEWVNDSQSFNRTWTAHLENVKNLVGGFRLGAYGAFDRDLNPYLENNNHVYNFKKKQSRNPQYGSTNSFPGSSAFDSWAHEAMSWSNAFLYDWIGITGTSPSTGEPTNRFTSNLTEGETSLTGIVPWGSNIPKYQHWHDFYPATGFHPTTMLIDAYNRYVEMYDMSNDQNPSYYNVDVSNDYDLFADREKPKGPIRVFTTTNPTTGEPNVIGSSYGVWGYIRNYRQPITNVVEEGSGEEGEDSESQQNTQPGTDFESHGGLLEMAYNPYSLTENSGLNCPWVDFRYNAFPTPLRTMIWWIKIWDRGKLVRDLIPVAKGDVIFDYTMPNNGFFDKVTEIFFGVENDGTHYQNVYDVDSAAAITTKYPEITKTDVSGGSYLQVGKDNVYPLQVLPDPTQYGKIVVNYYDYDNTFLGNKWVKIPTDYFASNITLKDLLAFNDMKPSDFYHDGILDVDSPLDVDTPVRSSLKEIYDAGSINVYYKQKQYTKTVVYYNENTRIASKDFFFSQAEIEAANSLADLGIDPELYRTAEFKPGVVMSDESIIASDDVAAFIDAPSPVVVYHKYTKEERPDLFYVEYYRGGAYEEEGEEELIINAENSNYLDCDLTARVLNHNGLIKYVNHYHSALYEDEEMPYFVSYQVDVVANYVPIYKGPARSYSLLGHIVDKGRYTVIEERNGWGRLKEYPKGWVLLQYTRAITGPGQNPDYDVPSIANVTIPFGTRLSITKMTIDRLWAYTPEYGSWIKTEEISFDEQGRLYSGLALKVFHLDRIDWANVTTFEDIVGDIQYKKPRYHDNSTFVYDGELTQNALSELHSVDIIYPETIYPYTVKYYKDVIDNDNIIGTGAFSCSLSDWNPDWDTFLSTSYLSGYDGRINRNATFYRTVGRTATMTIPVDEDVYILRSQNYNDVASYYIVWGGYVGYVAQTAVTVTDATVHTIAPILYRDTPLWLTWDFYDLDPNLYKPDYSYTDGILVWNPHTYDNEELWFTFEEIITTGGQRILYVPQVDTNYRAVFDGSFYRLYLGDISNFRFIPTNENPGTWDIEIKYRQNTYNYRERTANMSISEANEADLDKAYFINSTSMRSGSTMHAPMLYVDSNGFYGNSSLRRASLADGINGYTVDNIQDTGIRKLICLGDTEDSNFNTIQKYYNGVYYAGDSADQYYQIVNFSNKRSYQQAIAQKYGTNNWESNVRFKARDRQLSSNQNYDDVSADLSYLNVGGGCVYLDEQSNYHVQRTIKTDFYYVKVWHNYELIHYYVPLPVGYWLPNGTQMASAGFYDLITQQTSSTKSLGWIQGGTKELLNNRDIDIAFGNTYGTYDYFVNWTFDTENVDYVVKLKNNTPIYQYPDVLSKQIKTIEKSTIFPVKVMTSDAENHVQGTWYNCSIGWIQATNCNLITYDDTFTEIRKSVALKGDQSNITSSYYGFIRPEGAIPQQVDCDYFTLDNNTKSIPVGFTWKYINRVEMTVSGHLAPVDTGAYVYHEDERFGYILGNSQHQFNVNALNASTTRTNVQYNIKMVREDEYMKTYINDNLVNTVAYNSSNDTSEMLYDSIMIGSPYGTVHGDYIAGQANVNYHDVKVYGINNALIHHYIPKLEYNSTKEEYEIRIWDTVYNRYVMWYDKQHRANSAGWEQPKASSDTEARYLVQGDFSRVTNYEKPRATLNSFTTERLEQIFFECNEYYWNGVIWIPAAYSDDYKVMWDNPKTYITRVTNIYSYHHPIQNNAYRKNNYLAGDRFNVVGHLGKDENWYLLDDNSWMFNNDTFTELEN